MSFFNIEDYIRKKVFSRPAKIKFNAKQELVSENIRLNLHLKAGGKLSKCNLPPGAKRIGAESGVDIIHFAPELETIDIRYEIDDPTKKAVKAKLELFSIHKDKRLWMLDLTNAGNEWWSNGKHSAKWDGRVTKSPTENIPVVKKEKFLESDLSVLSVDKKIHEDFPDGYITLEHTSYKLKLTVGEDEKYKKGATAWTNLRILVKRIDLDIGSINMIPAAAINDDEHKINKSIYRKVKKNGRLPAPGKTQKIFLVSNIFKTASAQMNNNTAFTEYKKIFNDGPSIPIVAKISISDSRDKKIKLHKSDKGAVVLGNTKFLWDIEDPDENVNSQQSQAKPFFFIDDAIDYYKNGTDSTRSGKDNTYPKGDNCHVDRGGKRGPDAKFVFPGQDGYDPKDVIEAGKFPFKVLDSKNVKGPQKRKWAAYSKGWTKGKLKGQTGVVFRPSRMAGDDYKITVYLANEKDKKKSNVILDVISQPIVAPKTKKKSTGAFQIWREIHLARYIRKSATIDAFLPGNLGGVRGHYNEAYVEVNNKMSANNKYLLSQHRKADGTAPDYNTLARAQLTASGNSMYTLNLATSSTANHASVDSAFKVRDYDDFVYRVHKAVNPVAASSNDFTDWAASSGSSENSLKEGLGRVSVASWSASAIVNRLKATRTWLRNSNLKSKTEYSNRLDDDMFTFITNMAQSNLQLISGSKAHSGIAASNGITILHFNYTHTLLRDLRASGNNTGKNLNGAAIDVNDGGRNKCAFLFTNARLDTFSHEIGHHLFLPHAKGAPGNQPNRHDDVDSGCLMSYNRPRPSFCGLCQLRLRGWDATKLDKISAKNQKP
ncbi:MAG: hypothetical protein OQK56_00305 [Ignavibacteriaceae bacterium]|nr:hypothetical protein [Ignavibacteriaceae bacterium]